MKVGYLVNQYPKTSHSFIRREIAGVEGAGVEVRRFSVRESADPLVDEQDRSEASRTTTLLSGSRTGLVLGLLVAGLTRPLPVLRALSLARALSRRSQRGLVAHLAYLAEAVRLRDLLRADGIRHLHVHFATNAASVALLCRRIGGPPFSVTVHSTQSAETPEIHSLDLKLEAASFACAVCEHGRGQLYRWLDPSHWDKIHVVRCGLDGAFLDSPPTPRPESPRVVTVARLSKEKGILTLIDAAALVDEPFELVLVGDGPLRPAVEAAIARHQLGEKVHLTGWVDGGRVREEIASARALVIPSYVEGLPVVAMEALALGRPVVATHVGGLSELIEDRESGILVHCGSAADLARGLRWAISDQSSDVQMQLGIDTVRRRHDARREGARLAGLFTQALTAGE